MSLVTLTSFIYFWGYLKLRGKILDLDSYVEGGSVRCIKVSHVKKRYFFLIISLINVNKSTVSCNFFTFT